MDIGEESAPVEVPVPLMPGRPAIPDETPVREPEPAEPVRAPERVPVPAREQVTA